MKTIAEELIEIQIRKLVKCIIISFFLFALIFFAVGVINGIKNKPYKAKVQAYAADVQRVAQLIENQR